MRNSASEVQQLAKLYDLSPVGDYRGGFKLTHALNPHPVIKKMLPAFVVRRLSGGYILNIKSPAEILVFPYGNRNTDYPGYLSFPFDSTLSAVNALKNITFVSSTILSLKSLIAPGDIPGMVEEYMRKPEFFRDQMANLDVSENQLTEMLYASFGTKLNACAGLS